MWNSRLIIFCLHSGSLRYCSSRSMIIYKKEGDSGWFSLAASSRQTAPSCTRSSMPSGRSSSFPRDKKRSSRLYAMNSVSLRYCFFLCSSEIRAMMPSRCLHEMLIAPAATLFDFKVKSPTLTCWENAASYALWVTSGQNYLFFLDLRLDVMLFWS